MEQLVQIAGAILILAVLAWRETQWGFLLLESVWAVVSFYRLVRLGRGGSLPTKG